MNPSSVEILPGLIQIKLPVPIRSLGSVFAYFAFEGRHNVLVDTGWPGEETLQGLESALSSVGFNISEIETLVVSHLHPDHFGVAEEIRNRATDSKLLMHKDDAAWILNTRDEYETFMKELHDWLGMNGTPKEEAEAMYAASMEMLNFFNPPRPNTLVSGGEVIRIGERWRFRIIHTPGHTRGNICLYDLADSKVLFSGDHILPTITPNVSLSPRYDGNPLGDYLRSLESLKTLKAGDILPSHEYIFSNLSQRITEIQFHHRERLDEIVGILKESGKRESAYEVAVGIHWDSGSWESLSPWERRAALMETLAHLKYLKLDGKIMERQDKAASLEKVTYELSKKFH